MKIAGHGDLDTIVAHYDAIPLLIAFVISKMEEGGREVLDAWDEARTKKVSYSPDLEEVKEVPTIWGMITKLYDVVDSLKAMKPNDRSDKDRYYAICITEAEKLIALYNWYYMQGVD
jgi:hypothetical protein